MHMTSGSDDDIRDRHIATRDAVMEGLTFAAWIAGRPHSTDETVTVRDPATNIPLTAVPSCDASDVAHAVDAGWEGYRRAWSDTTPAERSSLLFTWIDRIDDHVDELTTLECLDTGKPIEQARGEVEGAVDTLRFFASVCRAQRSETIPFNDALHAYTRHEPYGVVGQIVPWNFPMWAAAWKLGPALAAGNACVLKPSITTPLTTIRIAQLSADILPDGVVNVVTGSGQGAGVPLVEHPQVRKVSFTGSTPVGKGVMRAAADRIAPVTLELGGKSPFIVFPDADMDKVVDAVADGIFYSTGEICDAFSRALVHEDIVEEFTDRFIEKAESYVLGDPLDDATTMGPLTSESQFETVSEYVDIGKREATLLTGGSPPDDPALADGWYFEPTVFGDVTTDMDVACDEIFGPVQTILSFETYAEAIEMANDTEYGLAAGIGTERTTLAHRTAADLDAGVIYVNAYGPIIPEVPYGGFKASGIGKDLGLEALDHYRQTKSVYVNLDEPTM